jgi:hypothetical protein
MLARDAPSDVTTPDLSDASDLTHASASNVLLEEREILSDASALNVLLEERGVDRRFVHRRRNVWTKRRAC